VQQIVPDSPDRFAGRHRRVLEAQSRPERARSSGRRAGHVQRGGTPIASIASGHAVRHTAMELLMAVRFNELWCAEWQAHQRAAGNGRRSAAAVPSDHPLIAAAPASDLFWRNRV